MTSILYASLSTEQANPHSRHLDRLSSRKLVALMNREDLRVLHAVQCAQVSIARAVELITDALREGGRLIFVGAGTSGRLGVIEAAECPPTFNTPPALIQAVMAGGAPAVFRSQEGAEDNESAGRQAIRRAVRPGDVVVGIAASGVTPFVHAALSEAKRRRAATVLVTCHSGATPRLSLDVKIILAVGPEILTGSTRLKSGTACKMVLNMLTTASMAQLGKIYDHWMVDLQPRSKKLVARGIRLISELGHISEPEAQGVFRAARGRVKVAILMARKKLSYVQAVHRLSQSQDSLRQALNERR